MIIRNKYKNPEERAEAFSDFAEGAKKANSLICQNYL